MGHKLLMERRFVYAGDLAQTINFMLEKHNLNWKSGVKVKSMSCPDCGGVDAPANVIRLWEETKEDNEIEYWLHIL